METAMGLIKAEQALKVRTGDEGRRALENNLGESP